MNHFSIIGIRRRHSSGLHLILALVVATNVIVFRHQLFWEAIKLLEDPEKRVVLFQPNHLLALFILLGGMQVAFMGLLLLGSGSWLVFTKYRS